MKLLHLLRGLALFGAVFAFFHLRNVALGAGALAVLAGLAAIRGSVEQRRHEDADDDLSAWVDARGFQITSPELPELDERLELCYGRPIQDVQRRADGPVADRSCWIADIDQRAPTRSAHSPRRYTVVGVRLDRDVAPFRIEDEGTAERVGMRWQRHRLQAGDQAFDERFGIFGEDERELRSLLDAGIRAWLLRCPAPVRVDAAGRQLLWISPRTPPSSWDALVASADRMARSVDGAGIEGA
jgi:hypothetical protein